MYNLGILKISSLLISTVCLKTAKKGFKFNKVKHCETCYQANQFAKNLIFGVFPEFPQHNSPCIEQEQKNNISQPPDS